MITQAYLIKGNGDVLFSKRFDDAISDNQLQLPSHVVAAITLLSSASSTRPEHVYTHRHRDQLWAYMFFESFTIVMLITEDENLLAVRAKMVGLGRAIAFSLGHLIKSWSGTMDDIVGLDVLFDRYVKMDLETPDTKVLQMAERLVNKALEDPSIAYAGILDVMNHMISGNLPDNLLQEIIRTSSAELFSVDTDPIPKTLTIRGYQHQIFRLGPLTVIVTPYPDAGIMRAVTIAGDMAHSLLKAIGE